MVSHFVKAGVVRPRVFSDMPWKNKPAGKEKKLGKDKPVLYAMAISKYCFKQMRKTIPPSGFLRECGLLFPDESANGKATLNSSCDLIWEGRLK